MSHQPWVRPFLDQLAETGIVSSAARAVGVSSSAVYALRAKDGDFAAAWDQALEDAADVLEAEARRRAVQGVAEPVVYQGQLTPVWETDAQGQPLLDGEGRPVQQRDPHGRPVWLTVTRYSDSLMALLLKGRRKKVFADRTELTGADGEALKVIDPTARAARAAHLLALAAARKAGQTAQEPAGDDFGGIA
jgi:hypothetical protein